MSEIDLAIAAIAARQHGQFTHADVEAAGGTARTTYRRVRCGAWCRDENGVLSLPGWPESYESRVMARVLGAGQHAVASHRTAALLHGLEGVTEKVLEVTVPYARRPVVAKAILHRSVHLPPAHCTTVANIPVTTIPRTLVDLGMVVPYPSALQALDSAVRQGKASYEQIWGYVHHLGRHGRAGVPVLRRALTARRGQLRAPDSSFSALVAKLVVDAGAPEPELEYEVYDSDGVLIGRLDVAWPLAKVAIEPGSTIIHSMPDRVPYEMRRRRLLTKLGWEVLEYDWVTYEETPHLIVADTLDLLRARGLVLP